MSRETTITEKSRVPLSILVGAVMITAAVVRYGYSIETDLALLRKHLENDWVLTDQENWSLRLQNSNPTLKVPDPRDGPHRATVAGNTMAKSQ